METVWVVTYVDYAEDPVVTVFRTKEPAQKCYEMFLGLHDVVCIDEVPLYSNFIVKE